MCYINLHFTYWITAYCSKNICCSWDTSALVPNCPDISGNPFRRQLDGAEMSWVRSVHVRSVLIPCFRGCKAAVYSKIHTCIINFAPSAFLGALGAGCFLRPNMLRKFLSEKKIYKKIYHLFTLLIQSPLSFCGIPIPKILSQKFPSWH